MPERKILFSILGVALLVLMKLVFASHCIKLLEMRPLTTRRLESCVDPSQAVQVAENSDDVGDGGGSEATGGSSDEKEEEEEAPLPAATAAAAAAAAAATVEPREALRGAAAIGPFPDSMDPFPAWQRRRSRSMASLLQEEEDGLQVADDFAGSKELSGRGGAAGGVEGQMQQHGKASGGRDGGAAHSGSPYRLRNSEEKPKVRKREMYNSVRGVGGKKCEMYSSVREVGDVHFHPILTCSVPPAPPLPVFPHRLLKVPLVRGWLRRLPTAAAGQDPCCLAASGRQGRTPLPASRPQRCGSIPSGSVPCAQLPTGRPDAEGRYAVGPAWLHRQAWVRSFTDAA